MPGEKTRHYHYRTPMIIDNQIRDLVAEMEEEKDPQSPNLNAGVEKLVGALQAACKRAENRSRYAEYGNNPGELGLYPTAPDAFVKAFDPLLQEGDFFDHFKRFGIVVGKGVIPLEQCTRTIRRIHDILGDLSEHMLDLNNPGTFANIPRDSAGEPVLSRGFFEIYHDDSLAQLRQSIRVYIHHVIIWGQAELWTSFDRFGVKLPKIPESEGLPLHVDQNPNENGHFASLQGVLALSDCSEERGTFVGAPGSKSLFSEYARMAGRGAYVQLDAEDPIAATLQNHAQVFPMRAGDLLSWDSRTTHANSSNLSSEPRFVAYIAGGPARENETLLAKARADAFKSGLPAYNHAALMHVSKKPRFNNPDAVGLIRQPERLTKLGKLLYGQTRY